MLRSSLHSSPRCPLVAGVSQIFNLVDRDKGGSISKGELAQLMDTLQINASPQEIDLMIGEIDQNGDGEVSFEVTAQTTQRQQCTIAAGERANTHSTSVAACCFVCAGIRCSDEPKGSGDLHGG